MYGVILTQYDGKLLGPIAIVLGWILDKIFFILDKINFPNAALAIILFTIVIYLLLTPLTIKQQKFSKLSAKMNPEIQAIQAKYKGKKDQASMAAMNEETQAVYKKYGVSPSGSCVQLIIQMPILFALYRVIYSIPAYVTQVGNTFRVLAEKIVSQDNGRYIINASTEELKSVASAVSQYSKNLEGGDITNGIIDVLNKVSSSDMINLAKHYDLSDLQYNGQRILSTFDGAGKVVTKGLIDTYNNFLGLNIANSPKYYITDGFFGTGSKLLAFAAVLIPVLSALTQWINTKLMPQAATSDDDKSNAMAASMKSMNIMMPLMSLVFVFSLPIGMGIYWIAGAVVRSVQQIFINKHIDKMDIDSIIEKNKEKLEKKIEKKSGVTGAALNSAARMSTKTLSEKSHTSTLSNEEREEALKKSTEYYNKGVKPGSLAAKANMVKMFNEKNNK